MIERALCWGFATIAALLVAYMLRLSRLERRSARTGDELLEQLASLRTRLDVLLNRRPYEPPPPPPTMVFVLVIGLSDDEQELPMTFGAVRELSAGGREETIDLMTQVPLKEVNVIVFADLRRVAVLSMYHGIEFINANLGECPLAALKRWDVGVRLSIRCEARS